MQVVFPSVLAVLVLLSSVSGADLPDMMQSTGCIDALSKSFLSGDCVFNFPNKEEFDTKEKFEAEVSRRVERTCSDKCQTVIPKAVVQVQNDCKELSRMFAIVGKIDGVAGTQGGGTGKDAKAPNTKNNPAADASKLAHTDLLATINIWGPHLAQTQRDMACLKEPETPKSKTKEYCLVSRVKNADFKETQWPKEISSKDITLKENDPSKDIFGLIVNRTVAMIGPIRETVPCSNASATSLNSLYDKVLRDLPTTNVATRRTFETLKTSLQTTKAAAVAEEAKKKAGAAAVAAGKIAAGHANPTTVVQGAAALGAALVAVLFMMA